MLGDLRARAFKGLPLGKFRQLAFFACFLVLRFRFQKSTEKAVNPAPALAKRRFAFGGKAVAAALENRRNRFVFIRRGNGAKHFAAYKG